MPRGKMPQPKVTKSKEYLVRDESPSFSERYASGELNSTPAAVGSIPLSQIDLAEEQRRVVNERLGMADVPFARRGYMLNCDTALPMPPMHHARIGT